MFYALLMFAQEEGGKPAQGAEPSFAPLILMGAIFLFFYLIVLRPANRARERERLNLLNNMKKNDKVITTAGIIGTIVSVSDKEDEIVVKVDDNTRLRMLKGSILRNVSNEEALK